MGMFHDIPKSFLQHLRYLIRDERGELNPGGSAGGSSGEAGSKGTQGDQGGKGSGASGGGTGGDDQGEKGKSGDIQEPKGLEKLDEETRSYIKSLRSENAKYRTDAKKFKADHDKLHERFSTFETNLKKAFGMEEDTSSPEEQVGKLQGTVHELQFRNAIAEMALESGLNAKQANYLAFLVQNENASLQDNEEVSDERIAELVSECKSIGGAGSASGGSTSPTGGDKKKPAPQGGSGGDLDAVGFSKMDTSQKTDLYKNNPDLYDKLYKEARAKRIL